MLFNYKYSFIIQVHGILKTDLIPTNALVYGKMTEVYVPQYAHTYDSLSLSLSHPSIPFSSNSTPYPIQFHGQSELKYLCRAGVPPMHRGGIWRMLIHGEMKPIITQKGPHYYNRLISEISESKVSRMTRTCTCQLNSKIQDLSISILIVIVFFVQMHLVTMILCTHEKLSLSLQIATRYRKQISLDLMRTMPNNILFDSIDAPGVSNF